MAMDRDYYRSLNVDTLLLLAREEGIHPEMAVAITEMLHNVWNRRSVEDDSRCWGIYQFNNAQ